MLMDQQHSTKVDLTPLVVLDPAAILSLDSVDLEVKADSERTSTLKISSVRSAEAAQGEVGGEEGHSRRRYSLEITLKFRRTFLSWTPQKGQARTSSSPRWWSVRRAQVTA